MQLVAWRPSRHHKPVLWPALFLARRLAGWLLKHCGSWTVENCRKLGESAVVYCDLIGDLPLLHALVKGESWIMNDKLVQGPLENSKPWAFGYWFGKWEATCQIHGANASHQWRRRRQALIGLQQNIVPPPCAWVNLQDVWVILIPLKNIYQELKIELGGEEVQMERWESIRSWG